MIKNICKSFIFLLFSLVLFSCSFISNDKGSIVIGFSNPTSRAPIDNKREEYSIILTSSSGKVFYNDTSSSSSLKIEQIPQGNYILKIVNPGLKYDYVGECSVKVNAGRETNVTCDLRPIRNQDIIFDNSLSGFKFDLPKVEGEGVLIECKNKKDNSLTTLSKSTKESEIIYYPYINKDDVYDIRVSFFNYKKENIRNEYYNNVHAKGGKGEITCDIKPKAMLQQESNTIVFEVPPKRTNGVQDNWFITYYYKDGENNLHPAFEAAIPKVGDGKSAFINLKEVQINNEEYFGKELTNPHLTLRFIDNDIVYQRVFKEEEGLPQTVTVMPLPKLQLTLVDNGVRLSLSEVPTGTNKFRITKMNKNRIGGITSINISDYVVGENPTNVEIFTDHFVTANEEYIYSVECLEGRKGDYANNTLIARLGEKSIVPQSGIGDLMFSNEQKVEFKDNIMRFVPELDFKHFTDYYPGIVPTIETSMAYRSPREGSSSIWAFSKDDINSLDFNTVTPEEDKGKVLEFQQVNLRVTLGNIEFICNFMNESSNIQNLKDVKNITVKKM